SFGEFCQEPPRPFCFCAIGCLGIAFVVAIPARSDRQSAEQSQFIPEEKGRDAAPPLAFCRFHTFLLRVLGANRSSAGGLAVRRSRSDETAGLRLEARIEL